MPCSAMATFSHNYNTLVEISPEHILDAYEGRLTLLEKSAESPKFNILDLISRLFSTDPRLLRVAETIDKTCRHLVRQIASEHIPLSSNSPELNRERKRCESLLQKIESINTNLITAKTKEKMRELIESPETLEARLAMKAGIAPKPLNQTSSGTYILCNRLQNDWGIFKPKLQELGGPKNPSWLLWLAGASSSSFGIEPGTSYLRERAAYLLDTDHFANVPLTTIATFSHPALDTSFFRPITPPQLIGSFQVFKEHCQTADQVIPAYEYFREGESVDAIAAFFIRIFRVIIRAFCWLTGRQTIGRIHRLAIFDLITLNCDRHLQNLLIDDKGTLHPIDHGLILPSNAIQLKFGWLYLAQSDTPFNQEELNYIRNFDAEQAALTLRNSGIDNQATIDRMKLAIHLLKVCAAKGFTPFEIAKIMASKVDRSTLFEERICKPVLNGGEDADRVIENIIKNSYFSYRG